jgi:predicted GH43/DUF377 family glycosyl hydrolase|tara:strand:+ start:3073 stop:4107 length:1035 start_codon:yes stop_codon:yes gene_type:complete
MHDLHTGGLANYALKRGGSLHPICIPTEVLGNETGIMNPSIFQHKGKLLVNVRHVNYILYHSEGKQFPHQWGPLVYIHPETDVTLRTHNVMCEFDKNLNLASAQRVNMVLDTEPTWNFIGLEDARLFSWDDKLFLCGVRRDCYDAKGKGRMEMANIEFVNGEWTEISRHPIPAPGDDASYCEKNWMPILDMPYHFVKWTNPTQVIKFDIENGTTEDAVYDATKWVEANKDFRGGSQVIRINENQRMAFVHETNLLRDPFGRKDGNYAHRVIVWDNDWNIVHKSKEFHFMGTYYDHVKAQDYNIEFVTGATVLGNDILISYGWQDNASYILRLPLTVFAEFLYGE